MWKAERACACFAVIAIASVPASAGEPQTRRGFWWSAGLGPGFASAACRECGSRDRQVGFSGWIRLGGTVNQHLLVGWEGSGWLANSPGWIVTSEDVMRTLGNSSLVLLYYPRAASGWYVKGGAGFAYAGFPAADDASTPNGCDSYLCSVANLDEGAHGNGLGWTFGTGYDYRFARNVSLTAEVSFTGGRPGTLTGGRQGIALTGWRQNTWIVALGFTFH